MLTVTNLSIRTKQTKETLVRSVSFSVKNGEALGQVHYAAVESTAF